MEKNTQNKPRNRMNITVKANVAADAQEFIQKFNKRYGKQRD